MRSCKVCFAGAWQVGLVQVSQAGSLWVKVSFVKGGKYMVYQWKPLACVKANAQAVGEQMEQLEARSGLTPKSLLDANREEGSPLHGEFEWNDGIAAEKYRENQAAYFIRQITVKEERASGEQILVRAFVNVGTNDGRRYLGLSRVLSDEDMRVQLLSDAKVEMQSFKAKYESLQELSMVIQAMNEVTS